MITIGIIGKICSGKSTAAKEISEKLKIPIVSFGSYLLKYSKENHLPTNRESLQNLGNKFIEENSNKFLRDVISTQSEIENLMIIEGIRHISIFENINKISDRSIFIFIDTPFEIRYERYCNRFKESDGVVSKEEFQEIDNHKVERETDLLKEKCHFNIRTDTRNHLDDFIKKLNELLKH